MMEKESELQRNLGSKEEKLQKLVEQQVTKEENISEKEKATRRYCCSNAPEVA